MLSHKRQRRQRVLVVIAVCTSVVTLAGVCLIPLTMSNRAPVPMFFRFVRGHRAHFRF